MGIAGGGVRSSWERRSATSQKLVESEADVFGDLAQQQRRNVSAGMVRNGGATAIRVSILHVRTPLANELEARRFQDATHLARFEHGWLGHGAMQLP